VAAIIFNMKKISGSFNLVLLAFAICVVGCKEPEVAPPPLVEHHTKIDGKLYDGYVISQGGNENCESIFVATHSLATESIQGQGNIGVESWRGRWSLSSRSMGIPFPSDIWKKTLITVMVWSSCRRTLTQCQPFVYQTFITIRLRGKLVSAMREPFFMTATIL
jgi:hypothetical protein